MFPNAPATEVVDAFVGWIVGVVGVPGAGIWLFVTGAACLGVGFADTDGLAFALLWSAIAVGLARFAIFFACCFLLFFFLLFVLCSRFARFLCFHPDILSEDAAVLDQLTGVAMPVRWA